MHCIYIFCNIDINDTVIKKGVETFWPMCQHNIIYKLANVKKIIKFKIFFIPIIFYL